MERSGHSMMEQDPQPGRSKGEESRPSVSTYYIKELDPTPEQTVVRERLGSKWETRLTYLGCVVGPTKIWRFPVLVLQHGGGTFVLAYLLISVIVGLPMSAMEYSLGQFSGKNIVKVWDMIPAFRGIGFSMCLLSFLTSVNYYNLMAQTLLYAVKAFKHTLPWTICKPEWDNCFSDHRQLKNITFCGLHSTPEDDCVCRMDLGQKENCRHPPVHASELFYLRDVLRLPVNGSEGEAKGAPSLELSLLLFVSVFLFTLCIIKGFRYTAKLFFVPVLLPILGLMVLTVKSALQPGAVRGLRLLFHMQWSKLLDAEMWLNALAQSLLSFSLSLGTVTMLGSYNHFHHRPEWGMVLVLVLDITVNIMACFIIFSTIGHSSFVSSVSTHRVDHVDLNVVFTVIPATFAKFPMPHVWSVIFFVMVYLLAIDPQFCFFEVVMTYLQDDFRLIRRRTTTFRVLMAVALYLTAFIQLIPTFHSLMHSFDLAVITICLPIVACLETTAIMWGYGFTRFLSDIQYMLNVRVRRVPYLCFIYTCLVPTVLLVVTFLGILYDRKIWTANLHHDYLFLQSHTSSACFITIIMFPILGWFLLYLWRTCSIKHYR